jgi:hypothetical protein
MKPSGLVGFGDLEFSSWSPSHVIRKKFEETHLASCMIEWVATWFLGHQTRLFLGADARLAW